MIQKSKIFVSGLQQRINLAVRKSSELRKNYDKLLRTKHGLINRQYYQYSQFKQNESTANLKDAFNADRQTQVKQELDDEEKQRQFILEQIESKKRFDEVFNIFVEKKKDEMRIVRLYKYYRKRYKHQAMNFNTFILLNLVIVLAMLILPSKEFNLQKAFQMRFVNILTDFIFYLQKSNEDQPNSQSLLSPKKYIEYVFLALSYMERNDTFDLDYIVKVLHNITLIIYNQSQKENPTDSKIPQQKETNLMILGSIQNISQLLKEAVQVRPHIFLEKDFQEVLTDYLEIVSLNCEDLAQLRRNFLNSKENLLNNENYEYFIENQLNMNQVAGILLLYNSKDKLMIYDCLQRLVHHNIDWNDYLIHFLSNFRIQLYKDIANQSESGINASEKALKIAVMLYSNKECQKRLVQDKLLSNLIKLFTIKMNNMHEKDLKAIVQQIYNNKDIMMLKENSQFREEFKELTNLSNSSNKYVKDILNPLFKKK